MIMTSPYCLYRLRTGLLMTLVLSLRCFVLCVLQLKVLTSSTFKISISPVKATCWIMAMIFMLRLRYLCLHLKVLTSLALPSEATCHLCTGKNVARKCYSLEALVSCTCLWTSTWQGAMPLEEEEGEEHDDDDDHINDDDDDDWHNLKRAMMTSVPAP